MDDSMQQQPIVQESGPNVKPVPNRGGIPVTPPPITPQQISHSGNKEQGPMASPQPDVTLMTETEVQKEESEIEKKLEALVEETPDPHKPKLTQEVKDAGVELAKETVEMPSEPSGKVVLPMTYEEAVLTRKKYKWKDSIAWFSALLVYHWKRVNFSNKKEVK